MPTFQIDDETILRPFEHRDAQEIYNVVKENYEHLRPFLHWVTPEYSLASAKQFIQQTLTGFAENTNHTYAIVADGSLTGAINLGNFNWPSKSTEIGYWVAAKYEGQGLITNSCKLLINYAFEELQINRIEIHCAIENVRSRAIPERLGFTLEGVLRQSEWRHDRFYDMAIYGKLKMDNG